MTNNEIDHAAALLVNLELLGYVTQPLEDKPFETRLTELGYRRAHEKWDPLPEEDKALFALLIVTEMKRP